MGGAIAVIQCYVAEQNVFQNGTGCMPIVHLTPPTLSYMNVNDYVTGTTPAKIFSKV